MAKREEPLRGYLDLLLLCLQVTPFVVYAYLRRTIVGVEHAGKWDGHEFTKSRRRF